MVLCYTMIVLKLYCSASPGERGGKPPQQVHTEYNGDDVDCDDEEERLFLIGARNVQNMK